MIEEVFEPVFTQFAYTGGAGLTGLLGVSLILVGIWFFPKPIPFLVKPIPLLGGATTLVWSIKLSQASLYGYLPWWHALPLCMLNVAGLTLRVTGPGRRY